jgi:hypothetical protein
MTMQPKRGSMFVFICLALFGAGLAAHHSQPGFDPSDKPIDVKGTVAEFRWRNPHVLFFWDVKDESGKVERWVTEFGSVATTISRGLNKDSFKIGEEVTVHGIRAKAGTPVLQLRRITKADGTVVGATAD